MEVVNAIGRRKAAIARVYVSEGNGKITVNRRELSDYFPSPILQFVVKQPLNVLSVDGQYDIKVNLVGGGFKGQSEAARLAITRALIKINPESKPDECIYLNEYENVPELPEGLRWWFGFYNKEHPRTALSGRITSRTLYEKRLIP